MTLNRFAKANKRAKNRESQVPKALSARYDRRIVIQLTSNLGIFFSPRDAEGLEHATPDQLTEIEISPTRLRPPLLQLDADLYLPSLLEGVFGSERSKDDGSPRERQEGRSPDAEGSNCDSSLHCGKAGPR